MRAALAILSLSAVAVATGCAAGPAPRTPAGELGTSPVCAALPALVDLRRALGDVAEAGASSELGALVDADAELGRLDVARSKLRSLAGSEAKALDGELAALSSALEARRARIEAAVTDLRASREAAEIARDATARCGDVDLRSNAPSPAGKCESAVRLWRAASFVRLDSASACAATASHLGELRMQDDVGAMRDALAKALRRHATALEALEVVAAAADGADEDGAAYGHLRHHRSEALQLLDDARSQCLATMQTSDRVVGEAVEPRRATVTVRPVWGDLESLGVSRVGFGSGFVVRWRSASGEVETRIVTNAHVMMGAFDARIIPGDDALGGALPGTASGSKPERERGWKATLVSADPVEDIAILRVEPAATSALQGGLQFRLEPAVEQELVTAAGFPGVGMRPSFQVSKGTVSNAAFGADDRAKSAEAFVQHTAAVDPGNSGGPLLDGSGRLMGMTTFKLVQRENVALAVPTPRIQLAMLRAEERRSFGPRDAEAACNAVASALAVDHPRAATMVAFGVALFDRGEADATAAAWSKKVEGAAESPIEEARRRAYGSARTLVEHDGGVRPYETCRDVRAIDERFTSAPKIVATLRARNGSLQLTFAEEHGAMRLVAVK